MASGDTLMVKQSGSSLFMYPEGGNEAWETAVGTVDADGESFTVTTNTGTTLSGKFNPQPLLGGSPSILWSDTTQDWVKTWFFH